MRRDAIARAGGFDNAILRSISLALSNPVEIVSGDTFSFRLSVRISAVGSHNNAQVRLWYDGEGADAGRGRDAGSRFIATIGGVTSNYFLRSGFALNTTAGTSRKSIDVHANRSVQGNPFVPFGTWSKTF